MRIHNSGGNVETSPVETLFIRNENVKNSE